MVVCVGCMLYGVVVVLGCTGKVSYLYGILCVVLYYADVVCGDVWLYGVVI